ncbi:MAG: septum formation inhibitor Maf [Acidobacteria bacterium]|nr:septum formation inhibitor Maf [Acidobacteriota bacterium]
MDKESKIILASSSPRRAEILSRLGLEFEVVPSAADERPFVNESPGDYIIRIARAKAVEVARRSLQGLVIAADTIVVLDTKMLGKPRDEEEARKMLKSLAGRWHAVMTGVALYDVTTKKEVVDFEKTLVRFASLSESEITWYLKTGEHKDKAGAYGIQGSAGLFVEEIAGNYHNVVGLPVPLVYRLAKRLGYNFTAMK